MNSFVVFKKSSKIQYVWGEGKFKYTRQPLKSRPAGSFIVSSLCYSGQKSSSDYKKLPPDSCVPFNGYKNEVTKQGFNQTSWRDALGI